MLLEPAGVLQLVKRYSDARFLEIELCDGCDRDQGANPAVFASAVLLQGLREPGVPLRLSEDRLDHPRLLKRHVHDHGRKLDYRQTLQGSK